MSYTTRYQETIGIENRLLIRTREHDWHGGRCFSWRSRMSLTASLWSGSIRFASDARALLGPFSLFDSYVALGTNRARR